MKNKDFIEVTMSNGVHVTVAISAIALVEDLGMGNGTRIFLNIKEPTEITREIQLVTKLGYYHIKGLIEDAAKQ